MLSLCESWFWFYEKVRKEIIQVIVIGLFFKLETEEPTACLRQILFICVLGLIPAKGKLVILKGEFTLKLLEFKRFHKLSADGLSSLSLWDKIFSFYGEGIV